MYRLSSIEAVWGLTLNSFTPPLTPPVLGATENFCAVLREIVADRRADDAVVVAAQRCLETTDWADIEHLMKVVEQFPGRDRLMSAYSWLVVERQA